AQKPLPNPPHLLTPKPAALRFSSQHLLLPPHLLVAPALRTTPPYLLKQPAFSVVFSVTTGRTVCVIVSLGISLEASGTAPHFLRPKVALPLQAKQHFSCNSKAGRLGEPESPLKPRVTATSQQNIYRHQRPNVFRNLHCTSPRYPWSSPSRS